MSSSPPTVSQKVDAEVWRLGKLYGTGVAFVEYGREDVSYVDKQRVDLEITVREQNGELNGDARQKIHELLDEEIVKPAIFQDGMPVRETGVWNPYAVVLVVLMENQLFHATRYISSF